MGTIEIINAYHESGFHLVRMNGKRPIGEKWQLNPTSSEFIADHLNKPPMANIGIVNGTASGGLIDVPMALQLTDYFLPETDLVFGKPSTPKAHRMYIVADAQGIKAFSLNGLGTIIELRGNGSATMVPPSVHPDTKEVLCFDHHGTPAGSTWEKNLDRRQRRARVAARLRGDQGR